MFMLIQEFHFQNHNNFPQKFSTRFFITNNEQYLLLYTHRKLSQVSTIAKKKFHRVYHHFYTVYFKIRESPRFLISIL